MDKKELSPKISRLMGIVNLPDDYDYKKDMGNLLSEKYRK